MEKLYRAILAHASTYYHTNVEFLGMERVLKDFITKNHRLIFPLGDDIFYFGIYAGKPLYLNKECIAAMSKNGGSYPNFNYVFSIKCENGNIVINQLTEHNNLDRCLTACVLKLYQYYK